MEIDEAIKNLKKLKSFHNGSYGTAIDLAIKALEQQTSEDCISREDVINLVHDLAQPCDDRYDWDISADEMIDGIKDLPSVTPKENDKLNYLKGRPCEVCDFHSDNGCSKWKCIFEEGTK